MIKYTVTFYQRKADNKIEKYSTHHIVDEEIIMNPHYDGIEDYAVKQSAWCSPDGDENPLFYTITQECIDY